MAEANSPRLFWQSKNSWYFFNEETKKYELTPEAPVKAIRSFELWHLPNSEYQELKAEGKLNF